MSDTEQWGDLSNPKARRAAIRRIGEEIAVINTQLQDLVRGGTRRLSPEEQELVTQLQDKRERLCDTRDSIGAIRQQRSDEEAIRYERMFMRVAKELLERNVYDNLNAVTRQKLAEIERRRAVTSRATGSVVTPNAGVAGMRERKE